MKGRSIAPCRTDLPGSPYRFLLEVGLLQHHRLGLAEPVPGALWVLGAQLHSAPLWSHNQRQLLAGALWVGPPVHHTEVLLRPPQRSGS